MDNNLDWNAIISSVCSAAIALGGLIVPAVASHKKRKLELGWKRAGMLEDKRLNAHRNFANAYCDFINGRNGHEIAVEHNKSELFKLGAEAYMISDENARKLINEMLQFVDPFRIPNYEPARDSNIVFWEYLDYISDEYDVTFKSLLGSKLLKQIKRKRNSNTFPTK